MGWSCAKKEYNYHQYNIGYKVSVGTKHNVGISIVCIWFKKYDFNSELENMEAGDYPFISEHTIDGVQCWLFYEYERNYPERTSYFWYSWRIMFELEGVRYWFSMRENSANYLAQQLDAEYFLSVAEPVIASRYKGPKQ